MFEHPRGCKLCNRRFFNLDTWLKHYNSQHSSIYRPAITGYRTCLRCLKFVVNEESTIHRCLRLVSNSRSTAFPAPVVDAAAPPRSTITSVKLEEYLIPCDGTSALAPTASSTPGVSSIVGAPDGRNPSRSQPSSDGRPRGDPSQASVAATESPGRQPGAGGDAGGDRPSKPTAAGLSQVSIPAYACTVCVGLCELSSECA